jgi:hypothetical protein
MGHPETSMGAVNAQPCDEFCPRCGHWHTKLNWYTGWCVDCSTTVAAAKKRANRALHRDRERKTDLARKQKMGTGICPTCGRGGLYLLTTGGVTAHPFKRKVGAAPCPGSGQPPTENSLQTGRIGPGRVNGPAPMGHLDAGGNP